MNGKHHGLGRIIHPDGSTYHGEWLDDKANGLGQSVNADGSKYIGHWRKDK